MKPGNIKNYRTTHFIGVRCERPRKNNKGRDTEKWMFDHLTHLPVMIADGVAWCPWIDAPPRKCVRIDLADPVHVGYFRKGLAGEVRLRHTLFPSTIREAPIPCR